MIRPIAARLLAVLLLIAVSTAACAPSQGMIATLTLLPGTFTPPPPTPRPTNTSDPRITPSATLTPPYQYNTETPAAPGTQEPEFSATLTSLAIRTPSPTTSSNTPTPRFTPTVDATTAACPPFEFDTTLPSPDTPGSYIGRHFDGRSLPAGLTWQTSEMLSQTSYSYTQVGWQNREMFWIQKLVCQDTTGKPYWEIADVLALPKLDQQANEVFTKICFKGQEQVPFTIAYGTYNPAEPPSEVVPNFTGWKLQVKGSWQMKTKFEALPSQSLTCVVPNH